MNFLTQLLSKISQNKARDDYEKLVPVFEHHKGITKKINQTYWTKNVPQEIQENIKHIQQLNPDWEYQLYDDNDIEVYIRNNYGQKIWSYYQRIDPQYGAARADLFRYLLMYKEGGVYIDLKSSMKKPLNDVLLPDDEYILSFWDNQKGDYHENVGTNFPEFKHIHRGEYMQWYIIAAPGHPFLRAVLLEVLKAIDTYNPYTVGIGWQGTVATTGPIPYTLVIEKEQANYPKRYRWVELLKEFGFCYSIYETEKSISYHATVFKKSDYRKGTKPVIKHKNIIIQKINIIYLQLLYLYRNI